MKRNWHLFAALLLAAALLFPLAACGGKNGGDGETTTAADEIVTAAPEGETLPADAELPTDPEETTGPGEEISTTAPGESTSEGETATESAKAPATPAEVLAAYTEVMNKAKKEAKSMRKLEYQQLGQDSNFESDIINNPTILEQANKLMTSKEKAQEEDRYTKGTGDMTGELPVTNTPVGCMVKDPGVLSRATARQLQGGNIELTLVMKPEDNPEPAAHGSSVSPSITGQMFNPMSKAGIDEILNGGIVKLAFFGRPPAISTRYIDCKSTLIYNPSTNQAVSLRQDYNVRINIIGKALGFMNITGYATLENVTVCDQFRY